MRLAIATKIPTSGEAPCAAASTSVVASTWANPTPASTDGNHRGGSQAPVVRNVATPAAASASATGNQFGSERPSSVVEPDHPFKVTLMLGKGIGNGSPP